MKKFLQIVFHPRALALYGLLGLTALVWWVSPLIEFRDKRPFDSQGVRATVIGLMLITWVLIVALRAWRRKRTNAQMMQGLSGGQAADRDARIGCRKC